MCCNYVQKCTFVILLAFSYISAEKPIVETTHGLVQGKVLKTILGEVDYYGFFGIPYAAPPLKDLRFLPPQPVEPWDEVLVATKEKKACIQSNTNILKGQKLAIFGTENCLYLNIFTPNVDNAMRPVIVFLYNHHFVSSYNKTKDYSPDFFIEEDIVIVTVEHRLSVMGFLSLEDEIVPGNSGLRDIVAALEWVKKNVAKFGGDPDKITLMGSRGGAAAVDILVHSTAKHLFSAAIIQGGTSLSSIYLQEEVKERAHKLGEVLERASSSNAKLLKELNELPAEDLIMKELQAAPVDYFKENQRGSLSFSPVVEKQPNGLITEYPEDSKDQIDIPIMIGYNSREGLEAAFQYLEEPRYLSFVQKDFPFIIPIRVKYKFDPAQEITYKAVDEIKDYYYDGRVRISHIPEHVTYLGDVLSAYPIDYTVKMYAGRTSNSLYYYLFDYVSDFNENQNNIIKISTVIDSTYGAAASDELCYLFYCPDLKKNYIKHNQSESEEIIMLRRMVKLWANFAKYRNPTPEGGGDLGGLEWPTYKLDNKNYLHIGKQIEVKTDLFKDRFEFWDNFIKRWEQRAVNGIVGSDSSDISDISARETSNTTSKDEL